MSNRLFAVLAIVAVAAGLYVIFGFSSDEPQRPTAAPTSAANSSSQRAEVAAFALPRADGGQFSSAALRGKSPVVVSFFATW